MLIDKDKMFHEGEEKQFIHPTKPKFNIKLEKRIILSPEGKEIDIWRLDNE